MISISTIVVGAIFLVIFIWAFRKTHKSMKNNTCPGCSGGCSAQQKDQCHK